MGINGRIAVSRKMLDARYNSCLSQSADGSIPESAHGIRIVAWTAHANHGVQWLRVDVAHGGIIHINANVRQGFSCSLADLVRELW